MLRIIRVKSLLLPLIFLALQTCLFAQLEDVRIETRNNRSVYVHIVQRGNTLWGLHKLYEVSVEDIIEHNPQVQDGLREGDTVYIPVPIITRNKTHIVQKGETLYSIAKQYEVSVAQLEEWNPESKLGLTIGQTLAIQEFVYLTGGRAKEVKNTNIRDTNASQVHITFNDSVVEHRVVKGETLYSIARRYLVSQEQIMAFNKKKSSHIKPGERLNIPLKKERIAKVDVRVIPQKEADAHYQPLVFHRKERYNIAVFLPFYLDKTQGYSSAVTTMSTEFLMGVQMALDSLEKMGLKAKVYVFDSENNAEKVASILSSPEFAEMDLIIGPLYKEHAKQLAAWCLEHKVRLICPINIDTQILQNNPYVYTTMASDMTLMKGLAKFLAEDFKSARMLLVRPDNSAKDSILYQTFRAEYNRLAGLGGTQMIETTVENLPAYLSSSLRTAIVYPTNDAKLAVQFVNELNKLTHKMSAETFVFGTDEWLNMDGINAFSRNKLRLTVPLSMDLNYDYPRTKEQHQKYRIRYRSDFTKIAIQGFDVMLGYGSELLLEKPLGQLIMNYFEPVQIGPNHGFENQHTEIITHDDYQLTNIRHIIE